MEVSINRYDGTTPQTYWIFCETVHMCLKKYFLVNINLLCLKLETGEIQHPVVLCHAVPPSWRAIKTPCGYFQSSITSDDTKTNSTERWRKEKRKSGILTNKNLSIFSFSIHTHATNAYISSVNTISAVQEWWKAVSFIIGENNKLSWRDWLFSNRRSL